LHRAERAGHHLRDVQHAKSFERGPPRTHHRSPSAGSDDPALHDLRFFVPIPEVQFTSEGAIAFLTFNRPDARNAMTWPMYDALADACDQVDADERIRAFVLRGAGDAFVAGTDISQFASFASSDDGIAYERRMEQVIERLERVGVPTIAQVHGVAAGGGCLIALACDLRVCSHAARFGVPIARTLGNCLSAANYARIVDLIGPARTKDLLFTGRLLDTVEAGSLGLVTRMAEPHALDAAVRELAQTIARNAPLTIRATKEAVRRIALSRRLEERLADDLTARCYGSHDFREGVSAFLEKRKPLFTGH
jgi:enoyl-CoA hydratase/carnithine racemase